MTDRWLQDIKARLTAYEAPVPDDLWQSVERALREDKTGGIRK